MGKIGIFYGSSTGATEYVAKLLANKLDIASENIFDVARVDAAKLKDYDVLLLGSSTLSLGELQDDWDSFIDKLAKVDLSNQKVGVFGLGDSVSYADTFCDAIGIIAKVAQKTGATLIGNQVDTSSYTFDESEAIIDGYFCGLPLDEDNESEDTENRINFWIDQLKADLN